MKNFATIMHNENRMKKNAAKNKKKLHFDKKDLKFALAAVLVVTIVCMLYRLSLPSLIICDMAAIIAAFLFCKEQLISDIELKRYNGVITYLEQILYSFKKRPKIREALMDAQKVSEDAIKESIEEIIVNIDSGESGGIYENALKIIEDEFPCKRVKSVHEFIIKIEQEGGEYKSHIGMLLNDIKAWNDRTRLFMVEVGRIKRNVLISIVATMITCLFMILLIPSEYAYTKEIIYQISTTVMIVVMLMVYAKVLRKLNFDWVKENPGLTQEQVKRYYQILNQSSGRQQELKGIAKSNYNTAKKRLSREISREFPDWLREVAVNLQVETVQSAIEHSYDGAPLVLKEPIRKLLLDFEDYPIGIEPYDNFLKDLELVEIKSSMKMLYSMCELGKEESSVQIESILDRNIKLEDRAEQLKNKDRIGVASFIVMIPMMVGVLKLMIDMVLMVLVFTSRLSVVMAG